MKKIAVITILFVALGTGLSAATPLEALVLKVQGTAYAKKPGSKLSETVQVGKRYAEGTNLRCDAGASLTLILSDNSTIQLPSSSSWNVGTDFSSISTRVAGTSNSKLFELAAAKLQSSASAATSNVVGSIRSGQSADPTLENAELTDDEADAANAELDALDEIDGAPDVLYALVYEKYKQLEYAQETYSDALDAAKEAGVDADIKDAALQLIDFYNRNGLGQASTQLKIWLKKTYPNP